MLLATYFNTAFSDLFLFRKSKLPWLMIRLRPTPFLVVPLKFLASLPT